MGLRRRKDTSDSSSGSSGDKNPCKNGHTGHAVKHDVWDDKTQTLMVGYHCSVCGLTW